MCVKLNLGIKIKLQVDQMAAMLEKVEKQIAETKIKVRLNKWNQFLVFNFFLIFVQVDQLTITLENHLHLEVQQNKSDTKNEVSHFCR